MPLPDRRIRQTTRLLLVTEEGATWQPALDRLAREGLAVERAAGVFRAAASFGREPADLAAIDLDAVGTRATECIRLFVDLHPAVRILVAFGPQNRRLAAEAVAAGAEALLPLPAYPGEVESILLRWAGRGARDAEDRQADRDHLAALARLAKGAAHEINNPLTTLSGWLQMMELDAGRTAEEHRRFASMREEADRIARVVEHLLAFGEDTAAERDVLDLDALVEKAVAAVSAESATPVAVQAGAPGARVAGDGRMLGRAIGLLVRDAQAACRDGGQVRVATRRTGAGDIEIRIHDTGRRIAPAAADGFFEPYRVGPRSEDLGGLAYSAAYGIVRSHGGRLDVAVDEPEGTCFRITLPTCAAPGAPNATVRERGALQ